MSCPCKSGYWNNNQVSCYHSDTALCSNWLKYPEELSLWLSCVAHVDEWGKGRSLDEVRLTGAFRGVAIQHMRWGKQSPLNDYFMVQFFSDLRQAIKAHQTKHSLWATVHRRLSLSSDINRISDYTSHSMSHSVQWEMRSIPIPRRERNDFAISWQ